MYKTKNRRKKTFSPPPSLFPLMNFITVSNELADHDRAISFPWIVPSSTHGTAEGPSLSWRQQPHGSLWDRAILAKEWIQPSLSSLQWFNVITVYGDGQLVDDRKWGPCMLFYMEDEHERTPYALYLSQTSVFEKDVWIVFDVSHVCSLR
jgi:hypothetical protein